MASFAWVCGACTFNHDGSEQRNFLACMVCETPRTIRDGAEVPQKRPLQGHQKSEAPASAPPRVISRVAPFGLDTTVGALAQARVPVILRGVGKGWRCCTEWTPKTLAARAREVPIRSFVSASGYFHLDGSWNPRTVLTCSMAQETTIGAFFSSMDDPGAEEWPSRYALDETLKGSHPLATDLPAVPLGGTSGTSGTGSGGHVSTQLFLSLGPTATQLHRDPFDNVYVVACGGARTWSVCEPISNSAALCVGGDATAVSAAVQPKPASFVALGGGGGAGAGGAEGGGAGGGGSGGVFRKWAGAHGSGVERACAVVFSRIVLEPGDGLFLPAGWWHLVEAQGPHSAAVNW